MKGDLRVKGLELETPFPAAAAMILRAKARAMFALEKKVRSGKDAEALHDMRVASRRVREAMEIFQSYYEPEAFKEHYRGVRRVTRTLGAARNLDVCIGFFSRLRKRVEEEEKEALLYLLDRKKKERKRIQKRMIQKLDRLDLRGLRRALRAFFPEIRTDGAGDGGDQDMLTRARAIVEDRLDRVFGYRDAIEQESDVDALHQMRIATKKLRYAIETLYVVFEEERLDEVYNGVRGMQELLGDIHDLDVFMGMVGDLKEEVEDRRRTRGLVPGMVRLGEQLHVQRHEQYEQFMSFIHEQEDNLKLQVVDGLRPQQPPSSPPR
jgi:CHAD domain-containing protein